MGGDFRLALGEIQDKYTLADNGRVAYQVPDTVETVEDFQRSMNLYTTQAHASKNFFYDDVQLEIHPNYQVEKSSKITGVIFLLF